MVTLILFVVVLAVLIFVHELGHFLAARACGIRVDEFAIGFGPKLWSTTRGETKYALNAIPFGGYVKIFGENPDDDSIKGPDSARSFVNKPRWQQAIVLVAGVVFNFIFAAILFIISFTIGVTAPVDNYSQYGDRLTDRHIAITSVQPGSPADAAGLKPGDRITGYTSVEEVQNAVNASQDKGIEIAGKNVVAREGIIEGKYGIGIAMEYLGKIQLPVHLAVYEGVKFTFQITIRIAEELWGLIVGLFNGSSNAGAVAGPVGIAGYIRDAAELGLTALLTFTALISINLGVLNLVPFPALDGGRLLFVLIESIIRRPIKPAIANTANAVGFSLLILLMVVVTYKDIVKIFVQ